MGLLSRTSDDALVSRLRAGDERAFEEIHARYRRALIAYAGRFLRRSDHDAEDVVQDVLLGAHRALRADERPVALRAYLYKLTRNRCIDEVRRARWGEAELPAERADRDADPAMIFHRREQLHRLVEDVAGLPERQRIALLARELDGQPAEAIGRELGLSPAATQMLIVRARDSLVKSRDARDASCPDIREELLLADERGVRLSEHAKKHVAGCSACAAYRRDLKRVGSRLRGLAPPVGLLPALLAGKLVGGGAAQLAALAAGAAVLVGGGITLLDHTLLQAGEKSPLQLVGAGGAIPGANRGAAVNRGSAVVYATVELPAGAAAAKRDRTVTLTCPVDMGAVGLARPDRELGIAYDFSDFTRHPRTVRVRFADDVLAAPLRTRIGIACRKPDANGSYLANPRTTKPGEEAGRVCAAHALFFVHPGRIFRGNLTRGDRVSILRANHAGTDFRIVTEAGTAGWVARNVLCGKGG